MMRDGFDWLSNIGQGLKETGDFAAIDDFINSRWPLFKTLEPIFSDRASSRPLLTNDEHLYDVEIDEESEFENSEIVAPKKQRKGLTIFYYLDIFYSSSSNASTPTPTRVSQATAMMSSISELMERKERRMMMELKTSCPRVNVLLGSFLNEGTTQG
jgi:hypothetical protein